MTSVVKLRTNRGKVTKKKEWKSLEVRVPLLSTKAVYNAPILTVTGPKGSISREVRYPHVVCAVEGNEFVMKVEKMSRNEKRMMFTYEAHIKNMVKGVTEGYVYKLVLVYHKFPVAMEFKNGIFTVKNLLGEKVPRTCEIYSDVKVEIKAKEITVSGIDKERTGQMAARIEQVTRITHLDRRNIQDGIFITEKPHKRYI